MKRNDFQKNNGFPSKANHSVTITFISIYKERFYEIVVHGSYCTWKVTVTGRQQNGVRNYIKRFVYIVHKVDPKKRKKKRQNAASKQIPALLCYMD